MEKPVEAQWTQIDGEISRQVTAIVIGCGNRGQTYSNFAKELPTWLKIVAVADPQKHRREKVARMANLTNPDMILDDWTKLAKLDKLADCAFITTQDQMHMEPAVILAKKGYHLLLEKPMSVDESECEKIAQACQASGVILAVCHVLRYFPPVLKIREIIDSGLIGEVVTIDHRENVHFWHFAHSFVRGNWRNVSTSTFSLLAKSCHDIDLIMFWMGDRRCTKIQSFGNLKHFQASEAPEGAAKNCMSCPDKVERSCPYSAKKIYLEMPRSLEAPTWPTSVVCDIEDHPGGYKVALTEALESGPYGRCVYACDNDVVDHQVVNMEFENGATAAFTMNAFTKNGCRETRICGTKGELRWDGSADNPIVCYDFASRFSINKFPDQVVPIGSKMLTHGGADFFLVAKFLKAIANQDPTLVLTGIKDSLRSHKLVFAAEKSRLNSTIETVDI